LWKTGGERQARRLFYIERCLFDIFILGIDHFIILGG
jgi:hypothetical protein